VVGAAALWATPAFAHVEIVPDSVPKGGGATVAFQVPNEMDNANTTQVQVVFPTDHPIATVSVQPVPGWTAKVETTKLAKPVQSDNGPVTEVVSQVTWSGGQIAPGQFQQFPVDLDGLPSDTNQLVFKALQTYSNGQVVRWIEEATAGVEPQNPAPVLKLTSASDSGTTAATVPNNVATTSDVDSAKTLAIIGIVVGALGLIAGVTAIVLRGRRASA
jgi:uncharacterized protein YcnI